MDEGNLPSTPTEIAEALAQLDPAGRERLMDRLGAEWVLSMGGRAVRFSKADGRWDWSY